MKNAPGRPGIKPHWTSSAKDGVGTAINPESRVWFTISHGILDEIYHPHIDRAATRDFGFLVADGKDFFLGGKAGYRSRNPPLGTRRARISA